MATLTFTPTFDLSATQNRINLVDTSDYAGQGIPLANVNGSFRIVSPSGSTIYDNGSYTDANCDIKVSTSTTSQQTINFTPELGDYVITYTVYDNSLLAFSTLTSTITNSYVAPTISITQTANCVGQVWTQEDATDYVVNGVTPTKTIVNTLYYPAGSAGQGAPYSTAATPLSTTTFYNGTQTSEITATLSYAFTGLTVTTVITGTKEMKVDCSYYCSILCCVLAFERLKTSYQGSNPVKYNETNEIFHEIMDYISLIRLSIECNDGDSTDISWYLDKIKALSNCTADCDCSADDYSRVTGWGSVIGADGTDGTNGTNGTNGAAGADGTPLLNNNIVVDTPSAGAFASLKSYTLLADQLTADGDAVEILSTFTVTGTAGAKQIKLLLGATALTPSLFGGIISIPNGNINLTLKATMTRRSATTVSFAYNWSVSDAVGAGLGLGALDEPSVVASNLTTLTNLIDVQGFTTAPDTIVCNQLLIKYLKI